MTRFDLHIHSLCSDGTDTPIEIIQKVRDEKLSGFSITDHDTIAAYTPDFLQEVKRSTLQVLKGVEISSEWQGVSVHILAYSFLDRLDEFLSCVREKRFERNREIYKQLNKKGMKIDEEQVGSLYPHSVIGRAHIAEYLLKNKMVGSIQEAYERYLKDGICCNAKIIKFSPQEVIHAIHESQGIAILAHPHLLKASSQLIRELLALPFDGIECYYGRFMNDQESFWVEMAKKRNWLQTGGSDYHGLTRPQNSLGSSWVNEETFQRLLHVQQ